MDFNKLILYANILGICFTVALTYIIIFNIIFGLPVQPVAIAMLAIGYVVMIKRNTLFQELWDRWFSGRKK
ncbi:hypothetical protein C2I06_18425 [Niallia circulans]|uniref:hypothetical protein n=1 Tax=Niallia circulans TaxID=1397 RepID=UPI000F45C1DE|nr:hypothetical protein [Niallia circulans]AYV68697.1 hypothetical protein C2I06_18425 [Niallia circulans]